MFKLLFLQNLFTPCSLFAPDPEGSKEPGSLAIFFLPVHVIRVILFQDMYEPGGLLLRPWE
jgi:hypothetical protein